MYIVILYISFIVPGINLNSFTICSPVSSKLNIKYFIILEGSIGSIPVKKTYGKLCSSYQILYTVMNQVIFYYCV